MEIETVSHGRATRCNERKQKDTRANESKLEKRETMLLYEIQSSNSYDDDILSEIIESDTNNKYAYKCAVSLARHYSNINDCTCAVIAHDEKHYNNMFTIFYCSPYITRYADAHRDALGFYMSEWRKGY